MTTQPTPDPAAPVLPALGPAGYSIDMIRPDMRDIPQFPIPEGFAMRPMKPDENSLWVDIWRDAEPYFDIADDTFTKSFGADPAGIVQRCFILNTAKGVSVGTISAWYDRKYRGVDYGRIHWVAIRQAYKGRGLGKVIMTYAMNQLAQWHDRAVLNTQSKRLNAVKLYLDFGFVPNLDLPGAIVAWREVAAGLKHPALEKLREEGCGL